ncbi:MAG: type II secretion system protein GspD, partial [Pseudomonadota bacterium]
MHRKKSIAAIFFGLLLSGCELMGPQVDKKIALEDLLPSQTAEEDDREVVFRQLENPELDKQKAEPQAEFYTGTGVFVGGKAGRDIGLRPPRDGKYTLNFDDADLGEVAKVILGETLNTNYTISPGVAGRVTLETARP